MNDGSDFSEAQDIRATKVRGNVILFGHVNINVYLVKTRNKINRVYM